MVKVLSFRYADYSGFKAIRVYAESAFEQAEKDLAMLQQFGNSDFEYSLDDVEFIQ